MKTVHWLSATLLFFLPMLLRAQPVVNLGADTTLCGGSLLLDAGNTGATFLWSTGATTQTITANTSNTYWVDVTDMTGTTRDSIDVTIMPTPLITQPAPDTSLCGGFYNVIASTNADVIFWRDSSGNLLAIGDTLVHDVQDTIRFWYQGHYWQTMAQNLGLPVSTPAAGFLSFDRGIRFQTTNPVRLNSVTVNVNVTAASFSATLHLINSVTNDTLAVQPISYNSSGQYVVPLNFVMLPGTYVLYVTDITGGTLPFINPASYPYTNASLGVTLVAGEPFSFVYPYLYDWQFSELDATCASAIDSVLLTALSTPVVNLGNDTMLCSDSLLLDATNTGAGYVYNWNTTATTPTIMATTTGLYKVTVSVGGNCPVEDSINIVVNTQPIVTQTASDTSLCNGLYNIVAATNADVISWRDSAGNLLLIGDTLVHDVQDTIRFWYQAHYWNNTTQTIGLPVSTAASGFLNLDRGIRFQVTNPVRLNSVTLNVNLTGANFTALFHLINHATNDTIAVQSVNYNSTGQHIVPLNFNITPGTYVLYMTDIAGGTVAFVNPASYPYTNASLGVSLIAGEPFASVYPYMYDWQFSGLNTDCTSPMDSVLLTALPTPLVNLGNDTTLCSDSLLLDATNAGAGYVYNWNTTATTPTIMATATGLYKVTVSVGGNCPVEDSIDIVVNTRPIITQAAPDTSVCHGLYNVIASTNADVIAWRDSAGNLLMIGDTLAHNVQNDIQFWYQAHYWEGTAYTLGLPASTTASGSLDLDRGIRFQVNNPVRLNSVTINVNLTGANFTALFHLINHATNDTVAVQAVNYNSTGQQIVPLNFNMSSGTYVLYMTNIAGGTVSFVNPASYPFTNAALGATLVAGEPFATVYPYMYDWQFSKLNTNCVSSMDSVVLTALATPLVNLGNDTILCSDSLLLDATNTGAGYVYNWNTTAMTPTIMATATGQYKVTVSLGGNCPVEDSINIVVNTRPVITQTAVDTSVCHGPYDVVATTNADVIIWRDSMGNMIDIGDTLTYNVQNTVQVWYQAHYIGNNSQSVGLSASTASSGFLNLDRGIRFQVTNPVRLNSVTVNINVSSNFSAMIHLVNSATGDTIANHALNYNSTGQHVVPLNFNINPGAYVLHMTDITGGTVAFVNPASYPFTNASLGVTLVEGVPFSFVYPYMYDWQFSDLNISCASPLDSVLLTALPTPKVDLAVDTIICGDTMIIDVSYPGASYTWDGISSSTGVATVTQEGLYKVTASLGTCSGMDSIMVYFNPAPTITVVSNDTTTCVELIPREATGADVHKWYTEPVGGTYLGDAEPFMYNAQTTDTIWVQGQNFSNKTYIQALVDTAIANLSGHVYVDRVRGLVFDVHENIRLKSVIMYVGGGNQFSGQIQLWDANNIALDSVYIALPTGRNVVPLNFDISEGQGYKLVLTGFNAAAPLHIDYPLTPFPLVAGDYVTIQQGFPTDYVYNFFYEWNVQTLGCASSRLPSIVNVLPTPNVDFPVDTIVCGDSLVLDGSSSGAVSYVWSTGATTASVTIDTTSTVSLVGTIGSCSDEDSINVFVVEPPSLIIPPNDTILCKGNATFHASGNAAYYAWYDSLNSSTSFAIGDSITVNLQDSTTLWVEGIGFIPKSTPIGEIYNPNNNINFWVMPQSQIIQRRLGFTINSPIILNSFKMYSDTITSGTITIYRSGFPFYNQPVSLNSIGENTVVLDVLLEPGNYSIEYTNNAAGNMLVLYPYSANSLSGISSPEVTFNVLVPSVVYNYFFEWKISTPSCATARLPFNVDVPPSPPIDMVADTATCILNSITLDPVVNNSPSYDYEWSNGSTGDTLNVTTEGYYGVTVTNSGHCSSEQDVFVQFLSTPANPVVSDTSICAPQQINLASTVNDGIMVWYDSSNFNNVVHITAPYQTYVADTTQFWVDVAPRATTRIGQQAYDNPADPSAYWNVIIANVFDVHEYTILDSVAIYLESAPATIDIVLMDSSGNVLNSTTYTSTQARKKMFVPLGFLIPPGQGYQLSFANIGTQFLVDRSALATTTSSAAIATITGTSVVGVDYTCFFDWHFSYAYPSCHSAPDSFDVTVNMPIALVDSMYTCDSVVVDLTHPNITSYNWSTGATTPMATLHNAGWHTVTISDGASCTVVDSIIIEKPMPVGLTDGNVVCDYILSTNYTTANASFVWNTTDTTGTITIPSIGVYTVTVTTNGGCVLRDTATISQIIAPPSPTLSNFVDACFTDTLDAGYGGQGMSYLWNTGDTTQTLIVDNSGFYSVTVTHPLGCSGDDYSVVTIDTLPQASFTVTKSGNSIGINNTSTGGNQAVSYLWNMGDSTTYQIPNPFHTYADTGCYRITLIVTNACGSDTARAYIGIGRPDSTCFTVGTTTLANVSRDGFDFLIVPNPNTGQFQLQLMGILEEESQVMLYDLNGRLVHQQLVPNSGTTPIEVTTDNLPDGMYFVRLVNPKQSRTQRVVILRQ